MVSSSRIFSNDEELGKKDDDHKPGSAVSWRAAWRNPFRYRKRRILACLVGAFLVWLLVHSIPTDLGPAKQRYGDFGRPPSGPVFKQPPAPGPQVQPTGAPPRAPVEEKNKDASQYYYNGVIKFYKLAASLHAIAKTMGHRPANRNVLFAASSLKSASALVPMACEMARWDRNYVHMAFLGRDDLAIDEILEVNGVDKDECNVFWHDGRPDYAPYSTDIRAEASVAAALGHINNFMHPQVIVMDDSARGDAFFVKAIRAKGREQGHPVIEIPTDGSEKFQWITKLDSGSLSMWHKATVDVVVHAPTESSGSLIRLIKSLQTADYGGLQPPRLIIELPVEVDPLTRNFLDNVVWPPGQEHAPFQISQLILRHRIPRQRLLAEEASIRFMESFYPTNSANSHVLLLSPQVQLSPSYYHYLRYNLLEYKYSSYNGPDAAHLLGLSLELPSTYLNGTAPFHPPSTASMNDAKYKQKRNSKPGDNVAPFLWQAPNSNAALYFGDKWVELHSFLTNRIAASHSKHAPKPRAKLISESLPAWTEYFLELMRARGYSLLYPGLLSSETLVTVHNELYQPPEEFITPTTPSSPSETDMDIANPLDLPLAHDAFLPAPDSSPPAPPIHPEPPLLPSQPLHLSLPFDGDLAELSQLPQLDYSGALLAPADAAATAQEFAEAFRREVGGCKAAPDGKRRKVKSGSAGDLFCGPDGEVDEGEWVEDVEVDGLNGEVGVVVPTPVLGPGRVVLASEVGPVRSAEATKLADRAVGEVGGEGHVAAV